MTEPAQFDLADLRIELNAAASALSEFARGPARRAAEDVSTSFERAGDRIARALGRAAADGETSFKQLAKVILEELAKIALENVFKTGGARPGFIDAGETLAPQQTAPANGAVAIHFHIGASADAGAIARHQGQIAAAVARAVAYGRRNL